MVSHRNHMPKKTFAEFIPLMMAESAKTPFDSPDWIFEIKLGHRAITVFDETGKPHLWSRNHLPLEAKFPAIGKAVSKLKLRSTVLDGEIVAVDETAYLDFSFCNDSKNSQLRQPCITFLMCFGPMVRM